MLVFAIVVSIALLALFIGVAVAGNRAHDRLDAEIARHKGKTSADDEEAADDDA